MDNYQNNHVSETWDASVFLYLPGEEKHIVGISAYICRSPRAKEERPVVSAFIGDNIKKIKALQPDLVIGFSDVQADLARDLILENLQVLITNQRTIAEILGVLQLIGRIVGYQARLEAIRASRHQSQRPRVYFEEWDDPMISAIQWISELIEIASEFMNRITMK